MACEGIVRTGSRQLDVRRKVLLVAAALAIATSGVAAARESLPARSAQKSALANRAEALLSSSGSFLAAMNAQSHQDMRAASLFFREVLKADPRNPAVIERAFLTALADGNFPEAFRFAEKSANTEFSTTLANATLAIRAIRQKQYGAARTFLAKTGMRRGRNADLSATLLTAWTYVGSGDLARALEMVDRFNQPEFAAYRNFFGGLMAEVAGNRTEAAKRLVSAYKSEPGTLRVADAYARHLDREGNQVEALKVYQEWESRNSNPTFVRRQVEDIKAGRKLRQLVTNVSEGAAEVLYGLGALSTGARDADTSLLFLQMASYLNPDDELVQVTIAELFEQMRQWERAGEAYGKIANGSPFRTRALLGRVIAYERLEKSDDAIRTLTTLLAEAPDEYEAVDMLGGLYRTKKRLDESIAVYSAAIDRLATPERRNWNLYFGRAVSYERNKQWAKAEPDFLKALDLLPDSVRTAREKYERAQVLNYLAYSWVDQGMNIEKSFDMLKRAVELAPEDGAIVDSLGWAYFRLGKFDDAVRELERAVELKPGDPTINDHLGDAYWKVGRRTEAGFKWNQARDLKPEPEDLPRILRKIANGLDDEGTAPQPSPGEQIKANGG